MRVLEITHMFPDEKNPNWGIFIYHHVKAIHKYCGVKVKVIAPRPYSQKLLTLLNPKWGKYLVNRYNKLGGIDVHYERFIVLPFNLLGENWFLGLEPLSLFLSLRFRIGYHIRTFMPDVIHAHTAIPDCWAAIKWGKKYRIPVICSFRGDDINSYPYHSKKAFEKVKFTIENADLITTVSKKLKQNVLKIAKPKKDIKVVYNGVNKDMIRFYEESRKKIRKMLGISENEIVLIQVGVIQKDKGVLETFEAYKRLVAQYKNLKLIFVGDGELKTYLENQIKTNGLENNVILVGRKKHEEIPHWLSAADIFIFPTYNEGMPNSLLEALAVGLPVVASSVGGIPEVIKDGWNGFLIPPKQIEELVQKIRVILNSKDIKNLISYNAPKSIENFTWATHAKKMCEYYYLLKESREE